MSTGSSETPIAAIEAEDSLSFVWADTDESAEDVVFTTLPDGGNFEWDVFASRLNEHGELPMM